MRSYIKVVKIAVKGCLILYYWLLHCLNSVSNRHIRVGPLVWLTAIFHLLRSTHRSKASRDMNEKISRWFFTKAGRHFWEGEGQLGPNCGTVHMKLLLPDLPNARDVVVNDLREILFENIYQYDSVALGPGDVVFDCGANIGIFSAQACAIVGKNGLVVCIEPEPLIADVLCKNLVNNNLADRTIIVQRALSDSNDETIFGLDTKCFTMSKEASGLKKDGDGRFRYCRVKCSTIDALVDELSLKKVDFIKMDIEGGEVAAITGAKDTIRKFRPSLAISVYHKSGDLFRIPRLIRSLNQQYEIIVTPIICYAI
jgi:FkbM family methyltransferase